MITGTAIMNRVFSFEGVEVRLHTGAQAGLDTMDVVTMVIFNFFLQPCLTCAIEISRVKQEETIAVVTTPFLCWFRAIATAELPVSRYKAKTARNIYTIQRLGPKIIMLTMTRIIPNIPAAIRMYPGILDIRARWFGLTESKRLILLPTAPTNNTDLDQHHEHH